jgi:hypothetical protein
VLFRSLVLPLSNEHGSQVKDQGRRQCCHNKHNKFPIGLHAMYLYFPDMPHTFHVPCSLYLYTLTLVFTFFSAPLCVWQFCPLILPPLSVCMLSPSLYLSLSLVITSGLFAITLHCTYLLILKYCHILIFTYCFMCMCVPFVCHFDALCFAF